MVIHVLDKGMKQEMILLTQVKFYLQRQTVSIIAVLGNGEKSIQCQLEWQVLLTIWVSVSEFLNNKLQGLSKYLPCKRQNLSSNPQNP